MKRNLKTEGMEMTKITKAININKKLKKISKEIGELNWVKYTTGYDLGVEKAVGKMLSILKNKKNYEVMNELLQKILAPIDKRRVELLKQGFEPYHLSEELIELDKKIIKLTIKLSDVINKHRNKIDGKEVSLVEIYRILREDNNQSYREKAYNALAQVNKPLVENGFIDLINLRKEYAEIAGANDFVEYKLNQVELDYKIFEGWKVDVRNVSDNLRKIRNEYAIKHLKKNELEPWNNSYLSSKL